MKFVITLIIVVGLSLGAWQIYQYWGTIKGNPPPATAPARADITGEQLPGLPAGMEGDLQTAEDHGAAALRKFLTDHRQDLKDPRRAWIELDYVVLAGSSDPAQARLVFEKVKERLTPASPVYDRMKQLEKTYE